MSENVDEKVLIAGILHDTLEDTNLDKEIIREEFGEDVLELVEFCTEPGNRIYISKEEMIRTWKERKKHTLNLCRNADESRSLLILADKLSSIQSSKEDYSIVGEEFWSRFNASKEDIAWYYISLREILQEKVGDRRLFKIFSNLVEEVFVKNA